jgi:hypothetical protein
VARRSDHGVLSFIARRLESTHILVVIALREGFDIPLLSTHLPEIHVGPLSEAASRELLDSVASDLDHQTRRLILDESLGNPLALLELPQAVRRQGTDGREGPVGSLRLSERLERTFSAQAAGLPRRTQAALLFAALDQELSISDVLGATRTDIDEEATTDVLEPALEAGLVSIAGSIVRFRHPLIRSALEQSATEHLGMLDNAEYHAGSEGQAGVVCQPRHPPRLDGGGGAGTLVWSSERHGAQGINCSLRRSGKPPCRRRLAGPKLSHTAQAPSATEARGVARPC